MRISWNGVNKLLSGEVIEERQNEYLVKMDNGKHMIVTKYGRLDSEGLRASE